MIFLVRTRKKIFPLLDGIYNTFLMCYIKQIRSKTAKAVIVIGCCNTFANIKYREFVKKNLSYRAMPYGITYCQILTKKTRLDGFCCKIYDVQTYKFTSYVLLCPLEEEGMV